MDSMSRYVRPNTVPDLVKRYGQGAVLDVWISSFGGPSHAGQWRVEGRSLVMAREDADAIDYYARRGIKTITQWIKYYASVNGYTPYIAKAEPAKRSNPHALLRIAKVGVAKKNPSEAYRWFTPTLEARAAKLRSLRGSYSPFSLKAEDARFREGYSDGSKGEAPAPNRSEAYALGYVAGRLDTGRTASQLVAYPRRTNGDRWEGPLSASDLAFIKKCAKAMRPGYEAKYSGWQAIAARPKDAAILLTYKPNVEAAIYAYAVAKGGSHARTAPVPAGYRRNPAAKIKITARRERIDRGGYASDGTYFGLGAPVYEVTFTAEGETESVYVRGYTAGEAKEKAGKTERIESFYYYLPSAIAARQAAL